MAIPGPPTEEMYSIFSQGLGLHCQFIVRVEEVDQDLVLGTHGFLSSQPGVQPFTFVIGDLKCQ